MSGSAATHPISVQSMCTTKTHDVNATLQQIAELTAAGCDIVRVACAAPGRRRRAAAIAKKSQIPVIADIHFQPKYVFAAIDAGCAAVRVNPGNIKEFDDQVGEIAKAAGDAGMSDPDRRQRRLAGQALHGEVRQGHPEALVESALWEASLFEEHDFGDIKISVKHNDPVVMVAAYELLAEKCDYPLHLGVTEAGPAFQGTIKSAWRSARCCPGHRRHHPGVAVGAAGRRGQGRQPDPRVAEPAAARLEIVSCPSCGRAQVDVYTLADEVTAGLEGIDVPLRVAVMGCVVNGPGEAREADLGVASGNGKGQIFVGQDRARVEVDQDSCPDRRDAHRRGHAALRGRGYANAGMAAVVAHAQATVAPVVSLYVNDYNTAARASYTRVGFAEVGTFMSVLF
jgi:(E)-4-hydroxy-3-methylbut-2-enyl-diphosphate synthase